MDAAVEPRYIQENKHTLGLCGSMKGIGTRLEANVLTEVFFLINKQKDRRKQPRDG